MRRVSAPTPAATVRKAVRSPARSTSSKRSAICVSARHGT